MRQPIVATLGQVDSGKTTILDSIRGTKVQGKEAGAITQSIGASEVPIGVVKEICSTQLEKMKISLSIPGLLFIDTPGHEVFSNLRKRGGSIADIAILVVDASRGMEAQTQEAITILRERKTPFIVAFNKIDAISGWRPLQAASFAETISQQRSDVADDLDQKIYSFIAQIYSHGFSAERFDRVGDFTKQIVIVPVSARTREGLPELLLFVAGLAQKFLEKRLSSQGSGKASILEVREEKGVGKTFDAILYEGSLQTGDEIVFPSVDGSVVRSKIKAILKPSPLGEVRDASEKFSSVKNACAASGIKIVCEGAGNALAGGTMMVVDDASVDFASKQVLCEVKEVVFEGEQDGAILRADALGSLEAIIALFSQNKIVLRSANIGSPTKSDVLQAAGVAGKDKYLGVVFAFNVGVDEEVAQLAENNSVKLFRENIIYNLVDGYRRWVDEEKAGLKKEAFSTLVTPAKIILLKDHCFRASKPCIVGVEILEGTLKSGVELLNAKGEVVGDLKGIQADKKSVSEAKKGLSVAVSIDGPVFGRQLSYGEELFVNVPKNDMELLEKKYSNSLSPEEKDLLTQIKLLKGIKVF